MRTYRRVEVDADKGIVLVERPAQALRPGEVRLRVKFCSVNRAELERIKGSYGGIDATHAAFYRPGAGAHVPGLEPSGVIDEVGEGVDGGLVGRSAVVHSHTSCGICEYCRAGRDNLCHDMTVFGSGTPGIGGWSEEVVVPASRLLLLPARMGLAAASTLEVTYGTAWGSLRRGHEITYDKAPVAVRGVPGGVALAATQFCRAWGVPVVGIVRTLESPRVAVTRRALPWLPLVSEEQVKAGAIVDVLGRQPSLIIEPLGGDYVGDDVDIVASGGAIGIVGSHMGAESSVRWDVLFHKNLAIYGTARAPLVVMARVADYVASGAVTPFIDRIFPLEHVHDALRYCDRPTGIGRVLLSM